MALMSCGECGVQVSGKEMACPHDVAPINATVANSSVHKNAPRTVVFTRMSVGATIIRTTLLGPLGMFCSTVCGALLSASLVQQPAFAEPFWQRCAFNTRREDCEIAGSSYSFTITYRSDGKQIQVEKVGSSHECGDGSSHECGTMLITEPKERRTTWATYRQTPNAIIIRSSRGNIYNIPY